MSSCVGTASRLACAFPTQTWAGATSAVAAQNGILALFWMAASSYIRADNELKLADVQIKAPTRFETYAGNRWRAVTWDTPIPVASGRALLLRAQGVTTMENWDMMQAFMQEF
ncbi:hypothetical protein B0H14DRAFT_2568300 [Mycena olivaceomarginata]|nr:hypothetical protein B0H14DRAFT_2568300 [Mycena olivaceomarginata]